MVIDGKGWREDQRILSISDRIPNGWFVVRSVGRSGRIQTMTSKWTSRSSAGGEKTGEETEKEEKKRNKRR